MSEAGAPVTVIAVVDGQGGGIGKAIIEKLKQTVGVKARITALGTNASATAAMLRAGADDGATGENAIIYNVGLADIIVGTTGIIAANSMLGELSPGMAAAIAGSRAYKVLVPVNRCRIEIAGIRDESLQYCIDSASQAVARIMAKTD